MTLAIAALPTVLPCVAATLAPLTAATLAVAALGQPVTVATPAAPAAADAPAAVYRLLAELLRAPASANWLRCLPAPSEETVEAKVSEAHDLTVGVSNEGEQLQLLRAMRQQLPAQPELALAPSCSSTSGC